MGYSVPTPCKHSVSVDNLPYTGRRLDENFSTFSFTIEVICQRTASVASESACDSNPANKSLDELRLRRSLHSFPLSGLSLCQNILFLCLATYILHSGDILRLNDLGFGTWPFRCTNTFT